MSILGINAYGEYSSVVNLSSSNTLSALCNKHSRAFPRLEIAALKHVHDNIDTVVTHQLNSNAVRLQLPRGTRFEVVDYCEALSMATIASTDWSSCAILLSDSYYTRLGYYVDGSFYWIREFAYPNSIALFSAAVTRFLGYSAITEEDYVRHLSMRGSNKYYNWIVENAVSIKDDGYQLLYNFERGFGTSVFCPDIAASTQAVFSDILVNLARWLRKHIDIPRLAIVGRSASNYICNSAIAELSGYDDIASISINGAAATALGAVALLRRPIYEHHYVGPEQPYSITPDDFAYKLLQGEIVTHKARAEFSDNSFINNNSMTLAYKPRISMLQNKPYYIICQDIDYHKYFTGKFIPYFGQYKSIVKNKQLIDTDAARVVCVSKNKNPYINRVLELTRAAGYPILVSTQINEI